MVEYEVRFKEDPIIAKGYANKFIQKDGKWIMQINGGTLECCDNRVIVLAD